MKLSSEYEKIWIYNIIIAVYLLHVSGTLCGHHEGGDFSKYILQRQTSQCKIIKY